MISIRFSNIFAVSETPGLFFFGGGSKPPKEPKPIKMPEMPAMSVPTPPPPAPPPPPPPTQSATEVQDIALDEKRQAARRKGQRATLIAGETGGYNNPATGGKSLLG